MRSDSPNRLVEISTGEDPVRELSPHVLCVSLLLFTPALVFTEDAGVTSIDAGVTVSQVSSLVERVLQALQVARVCPSLG